ncbi:MAG: hypothetical protein PVH61_05825 [Candidatus Aminicenantes bacterium]|jgi:hypothetical protein
MEIIKKDIKEQLGKLSKMNVSFLDFVEKNPGSLKQSNFKDLLELGYDNLQPWPIFINQQTKNQFIEAGVDVFNIIKSIPQRLFSNCAEKISRYYEIPQKEIENNLTGINDNFLKNLLARGDFILSPSGLKCVEYNVTVNLGGWHVAFFELLYAKNPIISKFLEGYNVKIRNTNLISILFDHLVDAAVEGIESYNEDELNIAIVSPGALIEGAAEEAGIRMFVNQIYGEVLQDKSTGMRGEIIFCDFSHLTIEKDCIFCQNKRIHVLLEMYHGDVPPEILEVFKKGNVLLHNGPITGLLSNKLNQAVLSENEDSEAFTSTERDIIKKYIPWTRKLVPREIMWGTTKYNLYDFVLSHQKKLVIKSSTGIGGDAVYIGRFTPIPQWKDVVDSAIQNRSWVVQEFVETLPYSFQWGTDGCAEHQGVWGLFVFGTTYAGGFLRVLPADNTKGVINTHQGATKTVVFEVED